MITGCTIFFSEFSAELSDFSDAKVSMQQLEKTIQDQTSETFVRRQKTDQKITNLEEASTMLIEKFNKNGNQRPRGELSKYYVKFLRPRPEGAAR